MVAIFLVSAVVMKSLTAYFRFCFLERRKHVNQRSDFQTFLNNITKDHVIGGMYNELVRLCNPRHSVVCFQMKFTVINYNTITANIRNSILKKL